MKDSNGRFWAEEKPQVLTTRGNCFRYYPQANVLSVSLPDWPDRVTGQLRLGKTVAVPLNTLAEQPEVLDSLIEILSKAKPIQD